MRWSAWSNGRADGQCGLLFSNGCFATHNHTIVLGRQPIAAARFARAFDCQAEADAKRDLVLPVAQEHAGPGTIETYTLFYKRDGSVSHGVVVARTPDGCQTLAKVPASDPAGLAFLSDGAMQPVGARGTIARDADGMQIWHR